LHINDLTRIETVVHPNINLVDLSSVGLSEVTAIANRIGHVVEINYHCTYTSGGFTDYTKIGQISSGNRPISEVVVPMIFNTDAAVKGRCRIRANGNIEIQIAPAQNPTIPAFMSIHAVYVRAD